MSSWRSLSTSELVTYIAELAEAYPKNLALNTFDKTYYDSLSKEHQQQLIDIIHSGIDIPESSVGCYARGSDDYITYAPFFDQILSSYHRLSIDSMLHTHNWTLDPSLSFDLASAPISLPPVSMRVRIARNVEGFPFTAALDRAGRLGLEARVMPMINRLIDIFGGSYRSMSTVMGDEGEEEYLYRPLTESTRQELQAQHLCFGDVRQDKYLLNAGCADDWPQGRGIYMSEDAHIIVWIGEEDHLRIMSIVKGTLLTSAFDNVKLILDICNSVDAEDTAIDGDGLPLPLQTVHGGAAASCPSNCGSGMRASIHIPLPNLTSNGTDVGPAKTIAKKHHCQIRGVCGEGSSASSNGLVDISPSARFGVSEADSLSMLYRGIHAVMTAERECSAGVVDQ
eukprot:gnl/Dysnectes_brevis/3096_a3850_1288.p1 GENE.gnl/Dysnectes_brevis/3096_a3850_1288~~gnl/Dysnectes_brevis/3096_a3850_1288.p1  ORF type:complete len:396 (-),score=60.90 gnl/Dysnectes_brevis/3096_a3850_1288:57-1244(-)